MTDKKELHDDEMEIVDEAQQMPVGTEEESNASVDKASNATKRSKMRRGDKDVQDSKQKVQTKGPEKHSESIDFSDQLDNLVEEEATLSDDFKAKTAVIFETALNSKISAEVERLEEEYNNQLEESVQEIHDELVEKVDSYLNYVVENWMKENELAVQQGLRTEIAEDFMNGLKDLFQESYVEVPESKIDLVDGLAEQVEELEAALNETTNEVMSISEELETYKRAIVMVEACEGLADTQAEKLQKLTEELDFENEESFAEKVSVVKESLFRKVSNDKDMLQEESDDGDDQPAEVSSSMEAYLKAMRKTQR